MAKESLSRYAPHPWGMQPNTSPWRLSACACAFLRSCSTVFFTTFSANHVAQLYIFPFSYSRTPCVRQTPRSLHYSKPIDSHLKNCARSVRRYAFIRSHRPHAAPNKHSPFLKVVQVCLPLPTVASIRCSIASTRSLPSDVTILPDTFFHRI